MRSSSSVIISHDVFVTRAGCGGCRCFVTSDALRLRSAEAALPEAALPEAALPEEEEDEEVEDGALTSATPGLFRAAA